MLEGFGFYSDDDLILADEEQEPPTELEEVLDGCPIIDDGRPDPEDAWV
jgi:hypothetical protein